MDSKTIVAALVRRQDGENVRVAGKNSTTAYTVEGFFVCGVTLGKVGASQNRGVELGRKPVDMAQKLAYAAGFLLVAVVFLHLVSRVEYDKADIPRAAFLEDFRHYNRGARVETA